MTATVVTIKRIDLGQLTTELAGVELSAVTRSGKTTITGAVDETTLKAAIAAHTAVDRVGNESTLRERAVAALAANRDFLALTAPTNALVITQVKALTRQNNALIRLLLQSFDGTD